MKKPPSKELVAVLDQMIDLVRRVENVEAGLRASKIPFAEGKGYRSPTELMPPPHGTMRSKRDKAKPYRPLVNCGGKMVRS